VAETESGEIVKFGMEREKPELDILPIDFH